MKIGNKEIAKILYEIGEYLEIVGVSIAKKNDIINTRPWREMLKLLK